MVEVERRLTDALGIERWALMVGTTAVVGADQIGSHGAQIEAIQQEQITALAPGAQDLQIIRSLHGHDGFLVESDQLGAIVRDALGICAPPASRP